MKTIALLILPALSIAHACAAQEVENEPDLQRIADELGVFPDEEMQYEEAYENLALVLSSPYDLNKVTKEELMFLRLLSDAQIDNLIAYRHEQGNFVDVHELQVVRGFDLELISKLTPFVSVVDPNTRVNQSIIRRIFSQGHSYFVSRYERTLERKKGFQSGSGNPAPFAGSPDKLYFRYKSSLPGDYSMGVTGEKDPGEALSFNTNRQWLFDFTSFHFQLQNKGKLKNIIAGDFQSQFAQGLLLGGAFGLGKGGESIYSTRKTHTGFLPYTAVGEVTFHRGLALTVAPVKTLLISAFYSRTRRDGSLDYTDSLNVTSLHSSGLHRTTGEIENRKKVREQDFGLVLHLDKGHVDAGIIATCIHYDIPVERKPTLYNQFAFKGSNNLNTGMFINYRFGNISFFSEAGQSRPGGQGVVAGFIAAVHTHLDMAILYRNYGKDLYTFHTNAFSEGTQPQNERGLYWGWKYKWNRRVNLTGYFDLFTFPWLGFRRYAPSGGYELLVRANYQPSRRASVFLQVREESKSRNLTETTTLYQIAEGIKRHVTVHCDYGIGEKIRLRSRVQYNSYAIGKTNTRGFGVLQDISLATGPFRFTGRHLLFDTDHYDNRLYIYEHDAWLAYSLPAYSGVGVRNYALIEYKVHKKITFWARYARTRLLRNEEIGMSLDAIKGNTRNDVKFQVRFRF